MDSKVYKILDISKEHNLSHLPSALSYIEAVNYTFKNTTGPILLGKPHGAAALYTTWLEMGFITKEDLNKIEPDGVYTEEFQRTLKIPRIVYVANTLGNAIGVAMGMAISNTKETYNVLVSDSSFLMGTTLETLFQLKRFNLDQKRLRVIVDWNSSTATNQMPIDLKTFKKIIKNLELDNFIFFENKKGAGVSEIENNPNKFHYSSRVQKHSSLDKNTKEKEYEPERQTCVSISRIESKSPESNRAIGKFESRYNFNI